MERSLLYVSRPSPFMRDRERTLDDIIATARLHNERVGITGALAHTPDHFAQVLEGPAAALDDLMSRIELDRRHTDVTILRVESIARRRLQAWSMAYVGTSMYVTRQIAPLIGDGIEASPGRIERLLSLLVGLAGPEATSGR